jgi:hypothetical protein
MVDLYIEGNTGKHPIVNFKVSGDFLIEGISICEDYMNFYNPVLTWLEELKNNLPETITLKIKLDFFNTGSCIAFLNLFNTLEDIHKRGSEVKIVWYYNINDEDCLQAGLDYESIINIPFSFEEIT